MPDWITHVLIAWTFATILGFRFKLFNRSNSAIVVLGALIPDIYKIYIILGFIGIKAQNFLIPIHFPISSFILAGLITLFFENRIIIFFLLIMGFFTHYALDLLLFNGGITLLYPFSLQKWQIGIISVTDYNITIISIIVAFVVYFIHKKINKAI